MQIETSHQLFLLYMSVRCVAWLHLHCNFWTCGCCSVRPVSPRVGKICLDSCLIFVLWLALKFGACCTALRLSCWPVYLSTLFVCNNTSELQKYNENHKEINKCTIILYFEAYWYTSLCFALRQLSMLLVLPSSLLLRSFFFFFSSMKQHSAFG